MKKNFLSIFLFILAACMGLFAILLISTYFFNSIAGIEIFSILNCYLSKNTSVIYLISIVNFTLMIMLSILKSSMDKDEFLVNYGIAYSILSTSIIAMVLVLLVIY